MLGAWFGLSVLAGDGANASRTPSRQLQKKNYFNYYPKLNRSSPKCECSGTIHLIQCMVYPTAECDAMLSFSHLASDTVEVDVCGVARDNLGASVA